MNPWNTNGHRIRRRSNGSIDTDYYMEKAHKVRAVAFGEALARGNRRARKELRAFARVLRPIHLVKGSRSRDATLHIAAGEARINLPKGRVARVEDGEGFRIRCFSGVLWITQERDGRDIVLESGDMFLLDRRGLAVVHALANAQFAMEDPQKAAASRGIKKRPTRVENRIVNFARA